MSPLKIGSTKWRILSRGSESDIVSKGCQHQRNEITKEIESVWSGRPLNVGSFYLLLLDEVTFLLLDYQIHYHQ